jgi:DNA processing protein
MDQRAYWVGFNLVKGIGAVRMQALQEYFGDLSLAWEAPAEALLSAGLTPKIVENFRRVQADVDLEKYYEHVLQKGIRVCIRDDDDYPTRLKQIDQAPPVLYMRGDISPEDGWTVAIVGTRRVTAYGRQVTQDLAAFLAANGVTVVSGLARGVDAIAHDTAMNAGGRTLAVLGSGVDVIYPPEHARLAERIVSQGAIISDYAPGTPPESANFPPRNRIISGLSIAVVVVEAGNESGALITAAFAGDQGREVFAVPGNIFAPQSKGANRLIQAGAHPLLEPRDVLDALNLALIPQQRAARVSLPADPTEQKLLKLLSPQPTHIDDLQVQSGLPIEMVSATLALMELKGLVRPVGGMNYVSVRENQSDYRIG